MRSDGGNKPSNLLKATFMKILKKLFNTSDTKIHIDEIALQMGGIPKLLSEAVILESGSNANGSYIKFGNGTMICWVEQLQSASTTMTAYGSLWHSDQKTWTFPLSFIDNKYSVFPSHIRSVGNQPISVSRLASIDLTKSQFIFWNIFALSALPSLEVNSLIAIGRWK